MAGRFYNTMVQRMLNEVRCCGCNITIGFAGLPASGAIGVGTVVVLP